MPVGPVDTVLEGDVDVPMVERIFSSIGLKMGRIFGLRGKNHIDGRLGAYNNAARHSEWFCLRDLDTDADCAPALLQQLLPRPAPRMRFRLAVRAGEAWLLGDRERVSEFLSVPIGRIPQAPDDLANPKLAMVNLARRSRRKTIRNGMVPRPGMSGIVGAEYSSLMIEFAGTRWRPSAAARVSPSLAACIDSLRPWVGE